MLSGLEFDLKWTLIEKGFNVHFKFLPLETYEDWEFWGPCRENLHYLWKRPVRITGAGNPMIITRPIIITGFPCNSYSPFP
jgi:hypothetical protein